MEYTSDITVRGIQGTGGDHMVVAAAKVSTSGAEALAIASAAADSNYGLINYLMKHRHGTPFEHSSLTFFVHAPAFVWWEWVRHRIGHAVDCDELSFNLESGRYRELKPVFWIPRPDRPMLKTEGYKPARPKFEVASDQTYQEVADKLKAAYAASWDAYSHVLKLGVAPEVARSVLGFGVYYSGWITCNARSLMHFLSLRTHEPTAKFVSYPQLEIEEAARACEEIFCQGWPLTHKSFVDNGRTGP